mgnify:CR=1 FL=1
MTTLREITPASAAFDRFTAALADAGLLTDDLTAEPFRYFSAEDAAWGGFSPGEDALLRSVVVAPSARTRGIGRALVEALAQRAQERGAQRLWLLTTDAAPFFARLGWAVMDRAQAPPAIAASRQFAGLCPASATFMARTL